MRPVHLGVVARLALLVLALIALVFVLVPGAAQAQSATTAFDHSATMFPLRGAHEQVRCETCHIKGIFKGTPRDCNTCHVQNNERGALAKPNNHIPTTQSCDYCHVVGSFGGGRFSHVNVIGGTCASCHNNVFAVGKPADHIPTTLSCDQCHVTSGFLPVRKFDHSQLGGNFTTCSSCHDGRLAKGPPANHIPFTDPAMCGTCHIASTLNGFTTFGGGQMDHAGITSGCVNCHGPSVVPTAFAGVPRMVVMPPTSPMGPLSHIPSSTNCETCHLANVPGGLFPVDTARSPPGTGFGMPAPTGAMIHTGVTGGCNACHETNSVWMGVSAYPIMPSTIVPDAQYLGFQTRPRAAGGTYSVPDPAHPSTGDCSACHFSTQAFTATDKPPNHIPYAASAQCSSCHTSSDFSVMPTLANIHANAPSISSNCAQCHGAAAASFAIPAANFSIVGLPGNHIPTGASCEVCHVGAGSSITAVPVGNGAKFSGSLMSHAGITSNCNTCHGPSISGSSFAGISRIVVMPPTSPVGASSHIPSSTTCETCHLGSTPAGMVSASATKSAPGSDFATPVPTTAQIHTGVTSGCSGCHEGPTGWMGMSNYPIAPTTLIAGAQYTGFNTRPRAAAGTFNVADAAHPSAGDCSQCHSNTNFFTAQDTPSNHIPFAATAQCNACHTSSDFSVIPTITAIHANAPSTSTNCAQCHSAAAAASFAIPSAGFSIVGLPGNHLPTSASCETCHVGAGSSIATTPVVNGAKFSGSLMNHSGITSNCAACHGPSISGSTFVGISRIVVMPPTSPAGASSHIPSSTTCETCHLGSTPGGSIAANATKSAPGTDFATPVPTTGQIHSGVTSGCSACHEGPTGWMGMSNYPIAPTTVVSGAQYTGFHTRPRAAAGTFNVADSAHPTGGDCSQCHSGTNFFTATDKPANHIPYNASAQCNACHTSSDFSVMPTLANIHANAPSTSSDCAVCHGSSAASFAIPAANFSIVGLPAKHIPTSASCELCHVGAGSSIATTPVGNGAKFSGSLMSHAGITGNCVACHGPSITGSSFTGVTRIVVMPKTSPVGPTSHIPSSTACESCHLATQPGGLISASATKSAPGTAFATPAPTTAQIHAGVSSGCSGCHESSYVWMGMSAYPISPTVKTSGAQYMGFQTRPRAAGGTYNVADASHPVSGDCSLCHSGTNFFTATDKPANHIPYAAGALCTACHISTDFSIMPTLTAIHANAPSTTNNCAQCHGSAAASFAIPAANFSIVGLPGNHIPTTASCEVCHVGTGSSIPSTPVLNGARFSSSRMSHTGITSNCAACHGPSITGGTFAGISSIVVMPPTAPVGVNSHIPSSTTCETCHLGTTPAGLIAANATKSAPGSDFATPAPTTAQIHTGISSGCSSCHETNFVWMGMSAYPISPTTLVVGAQYTGFHSRPRATGGTFNIADAAHPASGDCSVCHSGTNFFSATDKPANHIPYASAAQCTACHTVADFSVMPTLANIHANAQSTTSNCAQCHGSAAASFAIPSANFTIVGLPSNHIPTSTSCETCHVGAGSSITTTPVGNGAKFSGSLMNHAGITTNCVSCHGPSIGHASFAGIANIIVMPHTTPVGATSHIPSSTTCETCHLGSTPVGLTPASSTKTAPGTAFATPVPTTAQIHTGITSGCNACHDTNYVWMGMSNYPIAPTTLVSGAQYTGFHSRPRATAGTFNIADPAHPTTGDCSQCHSGTNFFSATDKPSNHIPYNAAAACSACHTSADFSVMPTLANIHANAQSTTSNCSQCHGSAAPSFAIPAANFSIVGLPSTHLPTSASCEVCHVGTGSSITATPVGNNAKFSGSRMSHAGITTNCVDCHGPTITGTTFAGVNKIVVMPPTSPAGVNQHIPSSTTCETCHLGTTPSGTVPASATKSAPGTLFLTPIPTTTQIHTGITSNCNACHEKSFNWMGMTSYPIAPTTLVAGAQYTGFNTRPFATATTFSVADPAHPTGGDCSDCHSGTNFFSATTKPANHIPYAAAATCNACHTSTDFSVMPTLANIHANAQSTTVNCSQCHGTAAPSFAIPAANFSIVGLPSNHVPTSASCEVCHVGTGSSIAATPVPNGAHFSGSLMSHSGITSNCVACHGPSVTTFAGITKIVVMPHTTPVGATSHIPSSTTCEVCHLGTTPSGKIAANAVKTPPGTAFLTPIPTTAQIHTGVTSNCNSCHDTGHVWMGMSSYPIAPTTLVSGAQYTGFHTRPVAAASTFSVADAAHPTTGDCGSCHSGTNFFTGQAKPAGHIPTSLATCSTCHVVSGDFSVAGLTTNMTTMHTGVTSNCIACHSAGTGAGPFAGCTTQAGCPATPPLTYQPKVTPLAAGGSPTAPSAQTHIPTVGITCEKCHSATVFTSFAGMTMKGNTPAHQAVGTPCIKCHEGGYTWFGATNIVTKNVGHQGRKAGQDCAGSGCHSATRFTSFNEARIRPVLRSAINMTNPRMLPDGTPMPGGNVAQGHFDHQGVQPGQCLTCHNGVAAKGKPVKHLATRTSCDSCHRTTAWTPAQFNHQGVLPGQCYVCHNGAAATGKPSGHFLTARSCDSCHRTIAWAPVSYSHLSPQYHPQPDKPLCTSCHVTNGEMIPRLLRGGPRPRPVPPPGG